MKSTSTWNGVALSDLFHQDHEVTMAKISIAPNERLPMHLHPVISVSYVLSGELTVVSEKGEKRIFQAGNGFLGCVNQNHYGVNNTSKEVEVLAVYFGKEGESVTKLVDDYDN